MLEKELLVKKGYNQLKDSGQLDYIYQLSKKLVKQSPVLKKPVFGLPPEIINLTLKQFFIQRILHVNFNESILIALGSNKKIKLGLPLAWLTYLEEKEGFKSVSFSNRLRWKMEVFYWYLVGIYFMIKYFVILIRQINSKTTRSNFVYFDNLNKLNFPEKFSNSKTIVNWYLKHENLKGISEIIHRVKNISVFEENGIKIRYSSLPFRLSLTIGILFLYLKEMTKISIGTFYKILKGDSVQALLLKEFPLLFLSKLTKKEDFAKHNLFHNSTSIYKPLWTYTAEEKGSSVILYFYSANTRIVKIDNKDHPLFGHKEFMSWKEYYVWNSYQEKYIKSLVPKAKTKIVGPIWFQANNIALNNIREFDKKIISIFDVQPYSTKRYQILGMPNEYYTYPTINSFHQDIFDLFSSRDDYLIVLKRKRNTTMLDEQYLRQIEHLYSQLPFIQIDPAIDASSLIEVSFASIHLPSTSTALIAKNAEVESIYYDATLKIEKNDESLAGVKLVQGKNELNNWIKSLDSK